MTTAPNATILGTGLLGASVGLALRSQGWRVDGWDPNGEALTGALERGAIETVTPQPDNPRADLVVLAAPPDAVTEVLEALHTDALVTDIAGVKTPVVASAQHLAHFVGGHPMAGGETSGPGMASSSMFQGATWILTSDGAVPDDIDSLSGIVASLGANPVVMSAADHDASVARVSHLPHLLAATLMRLASSDPNSLKLAGSGFRDLTRIAAGDSDWWAQLLVANSEEVQASIQELQTSLDAVRVSLGGESELAELLEMARRERLGLGEHNTQVRVVLVDTPGEIARVGHALETSRVDVRDFQLRHGEHGGGGVLTISVRKEGREALTTALMDEGFDVRAD